MQVPIPQHTCQQHQVIQTLSVPKGKLHTEQQADMFILPEVSMQEISSAADDMRALELEWQRMLEAEGISTAAGWHDETGRDAEQIVQDMLYSLAHDGGSSSALFRDIQVLLVLATQGKHSCLAILEAGGVAVLVSSLPSAQLSMQGLILATLAELITSNPQHASCNPEAEPGLVPALVSVQNPRRKHLTANAAFALEAIASTHEGQRLMLANQGIPALTACPELAHLQSHVPSRRHGCPLPVRGNSTACEAALGPSHSCSGSSNKIVGANTHGRPARLPDDCRCRRGASCHCSPAVRLSTAAVLSCNNHQTPSLSCGAWGSW